MCNKNIRKKESTSYYIESSKNKSYNTYQIESIDTKINKKIRIDVKDQVTREFQKLKHYYKLHDMSYYQRIACILPILYAILGTIININCFNTNRIDYLNDNKE